jgi:hypothetical protein
MRKHIRGQELENLLGVTNGDPDVKRKPALDLGAELRATDSLPNDKSARGADVDGAELLQLPREDRRPEGPVPSNVEAAQKHYKRHNL